MTPPADLALDETDPPGAGSWRTAGAVPPEAARPATVLPPGPPPEPVPWASVPWASGLREQPRRDTARWRLAMPRPGLLGEANRDRDVLGLIGRLRAERLARTHLVGVVALAELSRLRGMLGSAARDALLAQVLAAAAPAVAARDGLIGLSRDGEVVVALPARAGRAAEAVMGEIVDALAERAFIVGAGGGRPEHLRVTPLPGYALVEEGIGDAEALRRARAATARATAALDLVPVRYTPERDAPGRPAAAHSQRRSSQRSGTQHSSSQHRSGARRRPRTRLRDRTDVQIAVSTALGLGVPFGAYSALFALGVDPMPVVFAVTVVAVVTTALLLYLEQLAALEPEPCPETPAEPYPAATAVIAAYLPNESATIVDTIEAFLRLDYPGPLRIVLAYNTPRRLPVEDALARIAAADARFLPMRVPGSTSKAQNVNAALAAVTGEFVGVFDADHQPAPDAFTRAWRWLSHGATVVQGHCVVRNGDASVISRTVAVEFESIYAVSHPGRARMHGFGIFGGSNGYWRTEALHQIRMRASMLTEDIDASLRAILAGGRIVADPRLLSYELAPTTLPALWRQRMRWAHGWAQVSHRHLWKAVCSPALSVRQKAGLVWLLGWREVYPWLSLQMYPLILVSLLYHHGGHGPRLNVSLYLFTALFSTMVGPLQALFAYALADGSIRRHPGWFVRFCLVNVAYSEFKNVIARLAPLKGLLRDNAWHVTPRSGPLPGEAGAVGVSPDGQPPLAVLPRPPSVPPPGPPAIRPSSSPPARADGRLPSVSARAPAPAPARDAGRPPARSDRENGRSPRSRRAAGWSDSRSELADLAGFRGLAAVSVMVFHAFQFCRDGGRTPYAGHLLGAALTGFDGMISWFFLVSAFLLYRPMIRRAVAGGQQASPGRMLARRGTRILPLYYVAVLLVWAARNPTLPGDWRDLIEHLTFTQVFDSKRIFFTIGPAWSLAVEVAFYAYLAAVGFWLTRRAPRRLPAERRYGRLYPPAVALIVVNLLWVGYAVGIAHLAATDWAAWFSPQNHAADFGLGMIVAVIHARRDGRPALSARAATAVRLGGLATIVAGELARRDGLPGLGAFHLLNTGGFALVLASSVLAPRQSRWRRFFAFPVFVWLGLISYSAYLWHEPILILVLDRHHLVSHAPSAFPAVALTLVACGIGAGYLSYVVLERPAQGLAILIALVRRPSDERPSDERPASRWPASTSQATWRPKPPSTALLSEGEKD